MQPVTIRTLRRPFAIMALLLVIPVGLPLGIGCFAIVDSLVSDPTDAMLNWLIMLSMMIYLAAISSLWVGLCVIPTIRPRTLTLDDSGITYRSLLTSKYWRWERIEGFWPLGGYKLFLDVRTGASGSVKREFLGPFWPGNTEGVIAAAAEFRRAVGR